MREKEDYYEVRSKYQNTMCNLFKTSDRRIKLCNGQLVLVDGDFQMISIHELVDLVTGGFSVPPITINVCEEYTI